MALIKIWEYLYIFHNNEIIKLFKLVNDNTSHYSSRVFKFKIKMAQTCNIFEKMFMTTNIKVVKRKKKKRFQLSGYEH